ncbi:MAG: hypothetical protein JWR19_965 [Pedosphaera sp.]|nr:hypothetical protein [Pedosphaera sp.]
MKRNNPLTRISKMKIPKSIIAGVAAACILLCGSVAQAQSSIANVYPNGTNMFQPSSTLSFTANSAAGITNVTVQLTVTSLYSGQSFVKSLTAANGLTITGPSTAENVSTVLSSNTIYSAVIQIKDANGVPASQTVNFDTITPVYTWEGEDWDYTSNSIAGLYIDNPQTNAYANLLTTVNVDAFNANGNGGPWYRPAGITAGAPGGLWTETAGDSPKRLAYIGTTNVDWDVGFTDSGDFGQYTRHYPAGTYNMFVRTAGGGGANAEAADITVTGGTAAINSLASGPYKYGVKGLGWGSYDFMPVTDSGGNLVQITFDGSPSTLKVLQVQAADNIQFFMLMPVAPVLVSTVTITNISPDGSALYNPAGTFSFTASSPTAPVDPNNIIVQVTATNLWGHGSVTSLSASSGLTVTGPSTNLSVSFPTTTNTVYSVFIQITDANGVAISSTVTFDTVIETYTFEVEDFDYQNGQYFDNPQTNAYRLLDGVAEVDFHATQHGGAYLRVGLTTEGASDKLRPEYNGTGKQDYDVGFNDNGNWGNYTRNYPAGTYNIYVRASDGNGNGSADSGNISLVTSGVGTSSQTLSQLGKFGVPPTGGWQAYQWVPVKDTAGNLAQFTGGSLETLRMTIDNGNCNEGFILLTPADPSLVLRPFVDNFQPDGSTMFLTANQLSFVVHSQPGTATNNIGLNLNGVNVSGMSFSGTPNLRNVSYPVQQNGYYTAIVTVTDVNGTSRLTNSFNTFSSTNYQWEAEDYDYTNGQYFDNPQVGSYATLAGVSGTDYFESDLNGPSRSSLTPYRPANGSNIPDSSAGDTARDQFTAAVKTDYNIGSFGINSWANYTRHYPAGTYIVMGRFAEGAGLAGANLALLTNGVSTNILGTFSIPSLGWGTWQWQQLTDNSGNPVKVTFDGSAQILQLRGTTPNEANVNFLMLVPTALAPKLTATASGGSIHIAFPTQTGYSYQLLYKNHLTDANWTPIGSPISGNGAVQTANDSAAGNTGFYKVQVQ